MTAFTFSVFSPGHTLLLLWAKCLLLLTFLALPTLHGAEISSAGGDPIAAPLEDLRVANEARMALAREWQQWQVESERTYALLDGVQAEALRLRAEAAAANEATAKLSGELQHAGAAQRHVVEVDQLLLTQARVISDALTLARSVTVPGSVGKVSEVGDGRASFAAALHALDAAEHSASSTSVDIVEGVLLGERGAVRMLRVAGLGWWAEIDGPRAGMVRLIHDQPIFQIISDQPSITAIQQAIAAAEGRRATDLARLPLPADAVSVAP